jgi:hypothetical protein
MDNNLLVTIVNIWQNYQKGRKPSLELPINLPNFVDGTLAVKQLGKGDSGSKPEQKNLGDLNGKKQNKNKS